MNPQAQFCPNEACPARGQSGEGNIGVHSRKDSMYICHVCKKTFAERKGTLFHGLRTDEVTVTQVVTLLGHGCPRQAIVAAFGLDERTVKNWEQRAGLHCEGVHGHVVGGSKVDLQHVQADEIRAKMQGAVVWIAMAIMVSTRLWLGGAISARRDKKLIRRLADQIQAMALCRPLVLAVDGLPSYIGAFRQAFRAKLPHADKAVAVSCYLGPILLSCKWSNSALMAFCTWTTVLSRAASKPSRACAKPLKASLASSIPPTSNASMPPSVRDSIP